MANSNLLMQCLLGIQCQDFTIMAADQMNTLSVVIMKNDVDKIFEISDTMLLGVNGEAGDVAQFTQFIAKNLHLYKIKNKYGLKTAAVVHFIKKNVSDGLRNSNPYMLNTLVGGYDEETGARLYTMDFLAACVKVPYAVHGIGGLLCLSILDYYYRPNLTVTEAYELLKSCIREIQQRLIINLPNFQVKMVSKNGIQVLPTINVAMLMQ